VSLAGGVRERDDPDMFLQGSAPILAMILLQIIQ